MEKIIKKADTLIEALPYIQSFHSKVVVVKFGGSAMTQAASIEEALKDLVFMEAVKMKPVLIHGGGFRISRAMIEAGITPRFESGLRVTDRKVIEIVRNVLKEINGELVDSIRRLGGEAEGVVEAQKLVIEARKHQPLLPGEDTPIDLGYVGEIVSVRPGYLFQMLADEMVPVVAPLGRDKREKVYNINGDTMAAEVAIALKADKLVFLTDVEGIMRTVEGDSSPQLLSSLHRKDVDNLLREGVIGGGMIPKVKAGLKALAHGVKKIHIIDGRVKHSLLLEIFTNQGVGTEIIN